MIIFKSKNIDGEIREWKFDSAKDLEDAWNSPDADVPANDDPVFDVEVDGKAIWVDRKPDKDETEQDIAVWFEDLLTYVGIEIWK